MSLIVEDGTGLANAESLCSVTAADTYHTNLGNAAWVALTTLQKEQNLRKATAYMEQTYRSRWAGTMLTPTQALAWPRYRVPVKGYAATGLSSTSGFGAFYPQNVIPATVANVCAELAFRASTAALSPDQGRVVKRVKVGELETEYEDGSVPYTTYPALDNMLLPYLAGSGVTVVRS